MAEKKLDEDIALVRENLGNRSVVLVGLMGVGKTSVGRRLAEKLGLPFVDADHEIEKAAGQTILEIFQQHGEPYFREGEMRVMSRLLDNGPQILATGGGAYMRAETRDRIKAKGVAVWLKADLPLLLKRLTRRNERPLLREADPAEVISRLMDVRYPVYAEADVVVETRDVQQNVMMNEIIHALAGWSGLKGGQNVA